MKAFIKSLFYNRILPLWHSYLVCRIRKKPKIRVVFIAMKVSLWKYQEIYEKLKSDKRFEVYVVLSPTTKYNYSVQCEDIKSMRTYFSNLGVNYIDWDLENMHEPVDIRKEVAPDIIFYPQPYCAVLPPCYQYPLFKKSLICYYPYAFWMIAENWGYNLKFHNIAWKLFYGTHYNLEDAKRISINHGRNVAVVGYPDADMLLKDTGIDPWKSKAGEVKRLIWAPHFTLVSVLKGVPPRSNFLYMADFMLEVAKKYKGKLHIAFKPHPRLLTELYNHPDWGQARADRYYQAWEELENGQLEKETYRDLFRMSDAMIHDCGSFSADYLYFKKPVMFVSQDIEALKSTMNELGKLIYDHHYIGSSHADIISFIDDVVLNGNDRMASDRNSFVDKYLMPHSNKTVAQKTYEEIIKSLRLV